MSDEMMKMPELPMAAIKAAPVGQEQWPFPKVGYYTADQMRAFAQEATRQAMERECEWTRDSDFESEVWNTACDNALVLTDGGPAENDAKFCCYCGGKLRALIPQDPDHLAGVGNMVDGKDQSEKRHG